MNTVRLRLRGPAAGLRVDLRNVTPASLCRLGQRAAGQVLVARGNRRQPLGELFDVSVSNRDVEVPTLVLEGDFSTVDRIGWRMTEGRLEVHGDAGDYAGCGMAGGELLVRGRAGDFAGGEMSGGGMRVEGDCGDFAAASLPGSMDGMRGGALFIGGNAGERLADRMRRGTVLCLGPHPQASSTFVATGHDIRVYWSLLRRYLAAVGGVFERLPAAAPQRFVGDIAADGKGELLWFD